MTFNLMDDSLSRDLAAQNHYPAIDVLASVSRVARQIVSPAHQREVRVKIVHHRRTPPMEVVRRAVLPKQLLASATDHSRAPRALLRATLAYLVELWTGDGGALRGGV